MHLKNLFRPTSNFFKSRRLQLVERQPTGPRPTSMNYIAPSIHLLSTATIRIFF